MMMLSMNGVAADEIECVVHPAHVPFVTEAKPIMVSGPDAQEIVATLGKVTSEAKAFLLDYSNHLVK